MSNMAGTHLARATGPQDVKFGMSSKNNLQVAVSFRFTNDQSELYGQTITWIGTFAPGKASEIALQALENCGWRGDDVLDMTGIDSEEVELVIADEWNAEQTKQYPKVQFVNRPGAGRFEFQNPIEGQSLAVHSRALSQQFRAIRASQGRKPAAPAPAQQRRNSAPATQDPGGPPLFGNERADDELPF